MSVKLAEAYVKINVDTSGLAQKLHHARQMISGMLSGAGNTKFAGKGSGFGGIQTAKLTADNSQFAGKVNETRGMLGGLLGQVSGVAGGMLAAAGVGSVIDGIKGIASAMIGGNAEMERYKTAFKVFLGSEEAAAQRFQELAKFAADTPFEMTEVAKSSVILQNFAGSAAATGETLTMVGDMAAASGAPFQNVAFWVGRLMAQLKAGQPFGEAAARLTELGLMTGESRQQMEQMTKSGKSANEVWDAFVGSQDRVKGMMLEQSRTFLGLSSTLKDTLQIAATTIGAPFFEVAKGGLLKVLSFLDSDEGKKGINSLRDGLKWGITAVRDFVSESGAISIISGLFGDVGAFVAGAVRSVREFYQANRDTIAMLGQFLGVMAGVGASVSAFSGLAAVAGTGLLFVFGPVSASVLAIGIALAAVGGVFTELLGTGETFGEKINSIFAQIPAAIELAGFAFRNFGNLAQIALIDIQMALANAIPGWTSFVEGFSIRFVAMWDGVKAAFLSVFERMKGGLVEIKNMLTAVFEGVKAAVGALLSGKNPISAFGDAFSKTLAEQKDVEVSGPGPIDAFRKAYDETSKNARLGLEEQGGMGNALQGARDKLMAKIAADEDERRRLQEEAAKPKDVGADTDEKKGDKVDLSGGGSAKGGGKKEGGFIGLVEMSKSIQQSLMKSPADKAAHQTAQNTQKTADLLQQNNQMMEKLVAGGHNFSPSVATFGE